MLWNNDEFYVDTDSLTDTQSVPSSVYLCYWMVGFDLLHVVIFTLSRKGSFSACFNLLDIGILYRQEKKNVSTSRKMLQVISRINGR